MASGAGGGQGIGIGEAERECTLDGGKLETQMHHERMIRRHGIQGGCRGGESGGHWPYNLERIVR